MFTIKNMIPLGLNSGAVPSSEPHPFYQPFDAYQCDSFSLIFEEAADCSSLVKILELVKDDEVFHKARVYDKAFVMNVAGKTIDTIHS